MKAAELVMVQSWRKPARLLSDFNTHQFACVMAVVVFVLLLIFMVHTEPFHCGHGPDLPNVDHPGPMPNADREDAMIVVVTREGKIYFGTEQVATDALPRKIADRLNDHGVERKVYISADMRARWGTVKQVLDGVHAAGLMRVAFLVDQRRSAALHM